MIKQPLSVATSVRQGTLRIGKAAVDIRITLYCFKKKMHPKLSRPITEDITFDDLLSRRSKKSTKEALLNKDINNAIAEEPETPVHSHSNPAYDG